MKIFINDNPIYILINKLKILIKKSFKIKIYYFVFCKNTLINNLKKNIILD